MNIFLANTPVVVPADVNLSLLGQYGVLGVLTVLLIMFARTAYNREKDRADRLEDELKKHHEAVQDKFIPALESAASAQREMMELLRDVYRDRNNSPRTPSGPHVSP